MSREEHGHALGPRALEVRPEGPACRRIQSGRGFVEEEAARAMDEPLGDLASPREPAGQALDTIPRPIGDPELLEEIPDPRFERPAHQAVKMALVPKVLDLMKQAGLDDVGVMVGGIIPEADIPKLQAMGVAKVFGPGTPLPEIVAFLRQRSEARHA